jgi:eukaryotic-like serine/threonine-protein kinase
MHLNNIFNISMPSHDHSGFLHTVFDAQSDDRASESGQYGFLGRYRIDRVIGSGAMGAVFEAFDATLGRTLAIKTLHTETGTAQDAGFDAATVNHAILQEARTAAKLNHPHIVTVYDAGHAHSSLLGRELPFVAMELLHGKDLRSHLQAGHPYGVREAVALIGKLALALDHAHKAGVLHRDIKPANIFITAAGAPKLLDFGLAQFTRVKKSINDTTMAGLEAPKGLVLGSPQYMSPEVVRSVNDASVVIDLKSDIYSLGIVLYELLAGRAPFIAPSFDLLQERIALIPPEPLDKLNPSVPRELSLIVLKALAKRPSDRYRSAAQFARELRRWGQADEHDADAGDLASSPVPLMTAGSAAGFTGAEAQHHAAASPQPRQRSLKLPLIATAAVVLIAGAGLWWMGSNSRSPASAEQAVAVKDSVSPNEQIMTASSAAPAKASRPDTGTAPAAAPAAAPVAAPATAAADVTPPATQPTSAQPAIASAAAAATESTTNAATDTGTIAAPAEGRLRINVSPWAEVEVGGKKMGVSPPLSSLALPAGEHTVVLRNSDFPSRSVKVRIEGGKTASVSHQFN